MAPFWRFALLLILIAALPREIARGQTTAEVPPAEGRLGEVRPPAADPDELLQQADAALKKEDYAAAAKVLEAYLAQIEKDYILKALQRTGGNQTRAADILKMSVRSLRHLLDKHKIRQTASLIRESGPLSEGAVHK